MLLLAINFVLVPLLMATLLSLAVEVSTFSFALELQVADLSTIYLE